MHGLIKIKHARTNKVENNNLIEININFEIYNINVDVTP